MNFIIYQLSTGIMLRHGTCLDGEEANQINGPDEAVLLAEYQPGIVVGGQLAPYNATQLAAMNTPPDPTNNNVGYVWDWPSGTWVDQRTLTEAQAQAWTRIMATRDFTLQETVLWNGYEFNAAPLDRDNINAVMTIAQAAQFAGNPYTIDWTLANGTTLTMSGADVIAMGVAVFQDIHDDYKRAQAARVIIMQATTNAQCDAVVF